jgi:ABC-type transporter Mla subunit MlaD
MLGISVLLAFGGLAWLSTIAINGLPWQRPYTLRIVLPPGAPILHAGDDVDLAGERVGRVAKVAIGGAGDATATLDISGVPVRAGASARIRPRGLAGAVYVDLQPGDSGRTLPSGVLLTNTTAGVQLQDVVSTFDATARHAVAADLAGYGAGLAGTGVDADRTLAQTPALLSDTATVLRALSRTPGVLTQAIGHARALADALAPPRDATLARLLGGARLTLGALAPEAPALARAINAAPPVEARVAQVLPGASALLDELAPALRKLTPGVRALAGAIPGLRALERQAPGLSRVATVAGTATAALTAVSPALAKLTGPARGLTPLSTPAARTAATLAPYRSELVEAPLGFARWGAFTYPFGTAAGHRAVRFSMVLTCGHARDAYPAPGAAARERVPCR